MAQGTCSISDCGKRVVARGWCGNHYRRWRKYGDPLGGGPDRQKQTGECSVEGCANPKRSKGFCKTHYVSDRWHNDPEYRARSNAKWREWAAAHPEKVREKALRWERANPERLAEAKREWYAANRDKEVLRGWRRRRVLYGLPLNEVEHVDPDVVAARANGRCHICGEPVDMSIPFPDPWSATIDHIIPARAPEAEHSYANTGLAHWECNCAKNAVMEDGTDARQG